MAPAKKSRKKEPDDRQPVLNRFNTKRTNRKARQKELIRQYHAIQDDVTRSEIRQENAVRMRQQMSLEHK